MSDQTTIELEALLPSATLERLQAEAERQHAALSALVREAIEDYLNSLDEELEDTPDEKILADLREAWHEAMTGQTIPVDKALAELRKQSKHE